MVVLVVLVVVGEGSWWRNRRWRFSCGLYSRIKKVSGQAECRSHIPWPLTFLTRLYMIALCVDGFMWKRMGRVMLVGVCFLITALCMQVKQNSGRVFLKVLII
jgi:hypothetical protein